MNTLARATNKVLSNGGADVIAKLTPEQTKQFKTLASSTDEAQKQQLRQSLRQELGDDFEAANRVFEGSKLETISDAEASKIKGRGLSGLTPEQEAVADRLGNEFAQTIIERGQQAKYQKDKIAYIRDKLSSGRLVEEIGESKVRDFYSDPKAEVWSNVHLQAKDATGNNLGGQQAELDFFVHYPDKSSPSEIVSAKLNGKRASPKTDRGHLNKYYDIDIDSTNENLRLDLQSKFGDKDVGAYRTATEVVVKYTNVKTGEIGEIPLSEFRRKTLKPSINPETGSASTTVRVLAPDDTKLKEGRDIKLGASREILFEKITDTIDKRIKIGE